MTNALTKYKKEMQKHLRCCGSAKTRLMERFDHSLAPFLEGCDDPSMGSLHAAFGPPESMAGLLMSELTSEEAARYRRQVRCKRITAGILAVLLVAFTLYVFFEKQHPLEVKNETIIDFVVDEKDWTGPTTVD